MKHLVDFNRLPWFEFFVPQTNPRLSTLSAWSGQKNIACLDGWSKESRIFFSNTFFVLFSSSYGVFLDNVKVADAFGLHTIPRLESWKVAVPPRIEAPKVSQLQQQKAKKNSTSNFLTSWCHRGNLARTKICPCQNFSIPNLHSLSLAFLLFWWGVGCHPVSPIPNAKLAALPHFR